MTLAQYGVFLGLNGDKLYRLNKYRIVVIEPEEFSKAQVHKLKKAGKKILAYLNVGAIEKSRSYYKKFQGITLGNYEGWPEEKWVDISNAKWQTYTVERAKKWIKAGYDGFYVDNLDVVEQYPKKELYYFAKEICRQLQGTGKYIMINGADYFVNRSFNEGSICFHAIQQEEVFTLYDHHRKKYGSQKSVEKKRLKSYCVRARKEGLDVFLLEYRPSVANKAKIKAFAAKYGMRYYCASSIDLK